MDKPWGDVMARRRMIDPNFWQSEDVSKLNIRQRLLLIGLFSNADDEGKLRGNPALIRSTIFPYEDFSLNEITRDIESISSIGTILLYEVDGNKYIKLINWKKFQRVDKPQSSMIPDPTQEQFETDSKKHSENDSKNESGEDLQLEYTDSCLKERKGKEVKLSEGDSENNLEVPDKEKTTNCFFRYQEIFGPLGSRDTQVLDSYLNDGMEEEVILEAFDRTLKKADNPRFSYAKSILNDWLGKGLKTIEDITKHDPTNKKVVSIEKKYREVEYLEPPDLMADDWK